MHGDGNQHEPHPQADRAKIQGLVLNSVQKVLAALGEAQFVREISGKKRNRLYACEQILDIMNEGTQPA